MWNNRCEQSIGDARRCEGGWCGACEGCDIHCDCADTEEVRHPAKTFPNLVSAARFLMAAGVGAVGYVTWRNGPLTVSRVRPPVEPYALIQITPNGVRITNDYTLITL